MPRQYLLKVTYKLTMILYKMNNKFYQFYKTTIIDFKRIHLKIFLFTNNGKCMPFVTHIIIVGALESWRLTIVF